MTTATIPETVEIPSETLIETIAELIRHADRLIEFNGQQETQGSGDLQSLYGCLLRAVAPHDPPNDYDIDWSHPVVVEAYARAASTSETADLIREKRDARYTWGLYNGEES